MALVILWLMLAAPRDAAQWATAQRARYGPGEWRPAVRTVKHGNGAMGEWCRPRL